MSNVLPPQEKERISAQARARIVFVWSSATSLAALIAMLSLLPAFLSVLIPLTTGVTGASQAEAEQQALHEEGKRQVSRVRAALPVLAPFSEERSPVHALIRNVYALQPDGVSVERIQYQSGSPGQIILTGLSDAREPVNDFRTALVATGGFDSVSVPVAALVGALDGRFTMTLSGAY